MNTRREFLLALTASFACGTRSRRAAEDRPHGRGHRADGRSGRQPLGRAGCAEDAGQQSVRHHRGGGRRALLLRVRHRVHAAARPVVAARDDAGRQRQEGVRGRRRAGDGRVVQRAARDPVRRRRQPLHRRARRARRPARRRADAARCRPSPAPAWRASRATADLRRRRSCGSRTASRSTPPAICSSATSATSGSVSST